MILPPNGGPPPKGAAVKGRMERETLGPLRHVAADVKLKHCWERQEGPPGITNQVNPPPPPQCKGASQAPKQKVQHLSQNPSLSLSLPLSPSPLSLPHPFPLFHPPRRPGIPDPPDEPNLPPRPPFSFSLRTTGYCQFVVLYCSFPFLQLSSSFPRLRH